MDSKRLGPYQIVAPLGAGGMGEVYRAIDTRLDRTVAIKVLPAALSSDQVALDRFTREARAVSALNHPNICTLHDIGEESGRPYLVLEFLEGQTLQQRLHDGTLSLGEIIEAAIQISHALDAAHRKGIVHRDLKPANLFRTSDGRIKILDFGIAKHVGSLPALPEESATLTELTRAGAFAGTLVYASPEQIRGGALDGRSDLFSLGLVLYEILTGRLPYPGASMGKLLEQGDPPPLDPPSKIRRGVPRGLDAISVRLLERDPAKRFQTAAELGGALARLRRPARFGIRAAFAAAAILVAAAGLWWFAGRGATNTIRKVEYTRLTSFPDSVHSAALSRDGKSLAFVRGPITFLGGTSQVYVKVLPDGQPIALTQDDEIKMAPVFSPEGSRIIYTTDRWSSYSIPVAGGKPELFMENAAGLRWISPGRVLFSEIMSGGFHMGLVTSTESRADAREVYFPKSREGMVHFSAISPDGRSVVAVEMLSAVWQPCRMLPFDGSSAGRQVGPPGALCTAATWSPDNQWMYFSAEVNGESHLWRQRFPSGVPEQMTSGLNEEWGVTADPDGRSLITSVGGRQSTVWYHDETGDRPLSVEGFAYRPLVSPDGSRVFYLIKRGAKGASWIGELWSVELASGRNERVLSDFLVQSYSVSRDGKSIVFDTFDASGHSRIWTATLDRSRSPRKLSPDGDLEEQRPFFGKTGDIYFSQLQNGRFLYRMKSDGSARQKLSLDMDAYLANISPDEKWAVLWQGDKGSLLYPLAGGAPQSLCDCGAGPIFQDSPRISWTGDGKWLFVNGGGSMVGLGTTVVPWNGAPPLPPVPVPTAARLRPLPGAKHIREISIAPGPVVERYAFARVSEQSNLYRVRLP
ncbi:MAG: protein kinase [Acidobacteriia bacterium]|nr:protein kinase [Terriglobia bacterium]